MRYGVLFDKNRSGIVLAVFCISQIAVAIAHYSADLNGRAFNADKSRSGNRKIDVAVGKAVKTIIVNIFVIKFAYERGIRTVRMIDVYLDVFMVGSIQHETEIIIILVYVKISRDYRSVAIVETIY